VRTFYACPTAGMLTDMTTEEDLPAWLAAGASVTHGSFGTGIVGHVGDYYGVPTVWIDFDYGERKALSLEHGLPHLEPRRGCRPRLELRCDICGARPLVLNMHGQSCASPTSCSLVRETLARWSAVERTVGGCACV
jgi:hypothetical protein